MTSVRTHLTACAVAVAAMFATMLVAVTPAAADGGSSWPAALGAGMSGHQPDAVGPRHPRLRWATAGQDIGGWSMDGGNAGTSGSFDDLVLSSSGDLLVLAKHERDTDGDGDTEREGGLLSLDGQTGALNWATFPITDRCKPAVDGDGDIWVIRPLTDDTRQAEDNPDGSRVLVALDPSDGSPVAGKRYSGTDDATAIARCGSGGLRIAADGAVLLRDTSHGFAGNFARFVRAIDPADGSERWMVAYDSNCEVSDWVWTPPAGVPNADRVYVSFDDRDADSSCPHRDSKLVALDLATGDEVDEVDLPGRHVEGRRSHVADTDGGLVVATDTARNTDDAYLVRFTDDGGLQVDWQVHIDETADLDSPQCAERLCRDVDSLATTGEDGRLTGLAGGQVFSLDATDGSLQWRYDSDPEANEVVTDRAGTTYATDRRTDGNPDASMVTLTADGDVIADFGVDGDGLGQQETLGPLGPDGVLYSRTGDTWFALEPGPVNGRLWGAGRLETAVEVSQDSYPEDGSAGAVVLARSDVFADALSGTPFAVQQDAPMLITPSTSLADPVADEIDRVLGGDASRTVYLLGGTAALSDEVRRQVDALGYQTQRIAGADRLQTATEVADELAGVDRFLITTGYNFADALSAGPAAAVSNGAVLLTVPDGRAAATDAYLDAHPDAERFAVGGPAARGYPEAEPVVGATREGTAVAVANRFFDGPPGVGVARSDDYPDALAGGAHIGGLTAIADRGGPMLLTPSQTLSGDLRTYLCDNAGSVAGAAIYGGTAAIAQDVADEVHAAIEGDGC